MIIELVTATGPPADNNRGLFQAEGGAKQP
jgi:hypothetical protein